MRGSARSPGRSARPPGSRTSRPDPASPRRLQPSRPPQSGGWSAIRPPTLVASARTSTKDYNPFGGRGVGLSGPLLQFQTRHPDPGFVNRYSPGFVAARNPPEVLSRKRYNAPSGDWMTMGGRHAGRSDHREGSLPVRDRTGTRQRGDGDRLPGQVLPRRESPSRSRSRSSRSACSATKGPWPGSSARRISSSSSSTRTSSGCTPPGTYRKTPFIAMEFIDGEALDRVLARRGRLTWEEVVAYGKQLCEALQYAHEKGIIHRDLKPSNLMITREGIAQADRLRHRQGHRRDRPDRPQQHDRHGRVHVPGAVQGRPEPDEQVRPVLARHRLLRAAHREEAVLRRHHGGHVPEARQRAGRRGSASW